VWNTCGFSRQLSDLIYLFLWALAAFFPRFISRIILKLSSEDTRKILLYLEFLRSMIFTNVFLNKYFVFNYCPLWKRNRNWKELHTYLFKLTHRKKWNMGGILSFVAKKCYRKVLKKLFFEIPPCGSHVHIIHFTS
jgi:hypothetical protein